MSENISSMICWVVFWICLFGIIGYDNYLSKEIDLQLKQTQVELSKLEIQKLLIIERSKGNH